MSAPEPRQEDVQATFCAVVVDQWVEMGLRNAFVSPGSRSTPMAMALAERAEVRTEVVHDERAAGFMALGAGLASGMPAVALCTSGTAATHFHAAAVEADISGVPLILCTADRPPEAQGIRSAQTIDQQNLYGPVVRAFTDFGVPTWGERDSWRTQAANVLARTTGFSRGPVHVNLPFREPLVGASQEYSDFGPASLSEQQAVHASKDTLRQIASVCAGKRGVVVAGAGVAGDKRLVNLADKLGWPLLADSRSGLQHEDSAVCHADAILRSAGVASSLKPEVVLQFGEGPASKVVNQFLHDGRTTVIQISDRPEVRDPWRDVTVHVNADIAAVIKALSNMVDSGARGFQEQWSAAEKLARTAIADLVASTFSEPAIAATVANSARKGEVIVASSSMPVRDLEWYSRIPKGVRVLANRGANGIDGVLSTAIGVATTTDKRTFVMIGDVALLHDSSALAALSRRDLNLRIVVNHNDGGAIFSFLPQHELLVTERYEQLFGTPHGTDIVKLCKAHGLNATRVDSVAKLKRALGGRGIKVLVLETNRDSNLAHHAQLNAAVGEALSSL